MEQTTSLFWNWGLSSLIEGHCILVWSSIPISSPVWSSGRAGQSFANVSLDMLQVQPELALLYAVLCHHEPLGSVAFWGWMTAPPQNKGLSLSHLIAVPMPRYLCLNKYSASAASWIRDLKKLHVLGKGVKAGSIITEAVSNCPDAWMSSPGLLFKVWRTDY